MAWTYEQKFNTLNDGDLNSQDSWSGDTDFDVQTTTKYEGAKAVTATNANGYVARAITAISSGVFYIAMMRPDTNGDVEFNLITGRSSWMVCYMASSNIVTSNGAGTTTLLTGYTTNLWYLFEVTVISTSQYSIRFHNGTSWSSSSGTLSSVNTGTVDTIRLGCGGFGAGYWDTITPTNPIPVISGNFLSFM